VPAGCIMTCADGAMSAETVRAGGLLSMSRAWGE
jgi:hypothetical protein